MTYVETEWTGPGSVNGSCEVIIITLFLSNMHVDTELFKGCWPDKVEERWRSNASHSREKVV